MQSVFNKVFLWCVYIIFSFSIIFLGVHASGKVLSEGYNSIGICSDKRGENNQKYPGYDRSNCFLQSGKYYYYICEKGTECSSSNSSNTYTYNSTISTQNNSSNDIVSQSLTIGLNPYVNYFSANILAKLEKITSALKVKKEKLSGKEFNSLLDSFDQKLDGIARKYISNQTIQNLVGYLKFETKALRVNTEVDDFFCELTDSCNQDIQKTNLTKLDDVSVNNLNQDKNGKNARICVKNQDYSLVDRTPYFPSGTDIEGKKEYIKKWANGNVSFNDDLGEASWSIQGEQCIIYYPSYGKCGYTSQDEYIGRFNPNDPKLCAAGKLVSSTSQYGIAKTYMRKNNGQGGDGIYDYKGDYYEYTCSGVNSNASSLKTTCRTGQIRMYETSRYIDLNVEHIQDNVYNISWNINESDAQIRTLGKCEIHLYETSSTFPSKRSLSGFSGDINRNITTDSSYQIVCENVEGKQIRSEREYGYFIESNDRISESEFWVEGYKGKNEITLPSAQTVVFKWQTNGTSCFIEDNRVTHSLNNSSLYEIPVSQGEGELRVRVSKTNNYEFSCISGNAGKMNSIWIKVGNDISTVTSTSYKQLTKGNYEKVTGRNFSKESEVGDFCQSVGFKKYSGLVKRNGIISEFYCFNDYQGSNEVGNVQKDGQCGNITSMTMVMPTYFQENSRRACAQGTFQGDLSYVRESDKSGVKTKVFSYTCGGEQGGTDKTCYVNLARGQEMPYSVMEGNTCGSFNFGGFSINNHSTKVKTCFYKDSDPEDLLAEYKGRNTYTNQGYCSAGTFSNGYRYPQIKNGSIAVATREYQSYNASKKVFCANGIVREIGSANIVKDCKTGFSLNSSTNQCILNGGEVKPVCGAKHNTAVTSLTWKSSGLCQSATNYKQQSFKGSLGGYVWKCQNASGVEVSCKADKASMGQCGEVVQTDGVSSTPNYNLCANGNNYATRVVLSGNNYIWGCRGTRRGDISQEAKLAVQCSINKLNTSTSTANNTNTSTSTNTSTTTSPQTYSTKVSLNCDDQSIAANWYKEAGRCGENVGLNFWNNQIQNSGKSLTEVKQDFTSGYRNYCLDMYNESDFEKCNDRLLCNSGDDYIRNSNQCEK